MKLPSGLHRNHEFGAMTSMIDVVLFLLMFFVVTSGTGRSAMLLPAPIAETGAADSQIVIPAEDQSHTIDIWLKLIHSVETKTTTVDMNGTNYPIVEMKELLHSLAELDPANPVIFDIQPDVPLGDVVTLYDTCQSAGFEKISFAATE